jgi:hypothetical protein
VQLLKKIAHQMTEKKQPSLEPWWTASQAELVKDSSRNWERKMFKAVAGFWTFENGTKVLSKLSQHDHLSEGAVIDNSAWDHEHCELCWAKISEVEGSQPEGYTDGKEWLCVNCYDTYIAKANPT